jgi:hypothetical protein
MAGSLRWFRYTTDDNVNFAFIGDESNTEALAGQASNWTVSDPFYTLPGNLKPRVAYFQGQNGNRIIKVIVPTKTQYDNLAPSSTLPDPINPADPALTFVRKKNEEITRYPSSLDTGLLDGDNP